MLASRASCAQSCRQIHIISQRRGIVIGPPNVNVHRLNKLISFNSLRSSPQFWRKMAK